MQNVTLPHGKLIGIPLIGAAVMAMQSSSPLSTMPMALMIAAAAMIHLAAMGLRDAEFRALTTAHSLNAKDIFAYGCMILFDAVLLFGLVTGAGLLQPWDVFLGISALIALGMGIAALVICRKHYDPAQARPRALAARLTPPALLICMGAAFYTLPSLQTATAPQPFIWLVLLSAITAATDPATQFTGTARLLRIGLLLATLMLITWHYLNIA